MFCAKKQLNGLLVICNGRGVCHCFSSFRVGKRNWGKISATLTISSNYVIFSHVSWFTRVPWQSWLFLQTVISIPHRIPKRQKETNLRPRSHNDEEALFSRLGLPSTLIHHETELFEIENTAGFAFKSFSKMMTSRESGDLTKIQDDRSLFQFSNLSNIVCMKNVSYVFKVRFQSENFVFQFVRRCVDRT